MKSNADASSEPAEQTTKQADVESITIGGLKINLRSRAAKIVAVILIAIVGTGDVLRGQILRWVETLIQPTSAIEVFTPGPIEVFLPDPEKAADDGFYEDGAVQKRGFAQAIKDTEGFAKRLQVDFQTMTIDEKPENILTHMKDLYEKNNSTFFVMTMSRKVIEVQDRFKDWHRECVRDKKREPILVVTVASAPGLAEADAGIFRWYVRSDEETAVLSAYMRWKLGVTDVAIFFITRTPGQQDDAYGTRSRDLFQERFLKLRGSSVTSFPITARTAGNEVKTFLNGYNQGKSMKEHKTGAFVVGYGDAVRDAVTALINGGFDGPIMCSSTFTEPDWQPAEKTADDRIFTVIPRFKGTPKVLEGNDKNVVFFLAKDTLKQLLQATNGNPDSEGFLKRWLDVTKKNDLDHDLLADGDAVIRVDVVSADKWR